MELAFATKPLRELCESEKVAERELGVRLAARVKRRLADLRAADTVHDLVGKQTITGGNPHEHLILPLGRDGYLVLVANHNRNPVTDSGNIDWSRVGRIKIMKIEAKDE